MATERTALLATSKDRLTGPNGNEAESSWLGRRCSVRAIVVVSLLILCTLVFSMLLVVVVVHPLADNKNNPESSRPISTNQAAILGPEAVASIRASKGPSDGGPYDVSFQDLGAHMIPPWYDNLVGSQLDILTDTVMPGDVYRMRKFLLKTRDLLDVFSPIYPNQTKLEAGNDKDMWALIRHYLDKGYEEVGHFQDLHNAHIRYSDKHLTHLRNRVLNWDRDFEHFRGLHNASSFLAAPSWKSYLHKESHLFWMNAETLPWGRDSATASLQALGCVQIRNALAYLKQVSGFQAVLQDNIHEVYHNLRKQIRSVTDEYDLFRSVMFPDSPETDEAIEILKTSRQLLGEINDDWTAYNDYYVRDKHKSETKRLAERIQDEWRSFLLWMKQTDIEATMEGLLDRMNEMLPPPTSHNVPSLEHFLRERHRQPTRSFVIGNEAGDADTIVSAVALAYIESITEGVPKTPVVAIPKIDLNTLRPEVTLLFQFAGISQEKLLCVDNPFVVDLNYPANVTLVDHNAMAKTLEEKNWKVVEIVDHHRDEGLYMDSCPEGAARDIAFANDKALVASACTLVAERMQGCLSPPFPAAVSVLLMGVILLDSVNLSEEVGKVTQRDISAVQHLLDQTDWGELSEKTKQLLHVTPSEGPNPNLLFNLLQNAKYGPDFWSSLSIRDALRYDYKAFSGTNGKFGVSTVLMSAPHFLEKDKIVSGMLAYMEEVQVELLGIMFAFVDENGKLQRQLGFCGTREFPMEKLMFFLSLSDCDQDTLELQELVSLPQINDNGGSELSLKIFNQRNVEPSRKQIGPILVHFFELYGASRGSESSRG